MRVVRKVLNRWEGLSLPVKASICFLICGFLQKGISLITTPIFTRLLSTSEYGIYSVYNSWMGIITIFTTLQLYSGVYMRGLVKYDNDRENFSSAIQGISCLIWLIFFAIYIVFHGFWNKLFNQSTLLMLTMFIMIWTSMSFNFWSARQRVDYKYKLLVRVTIFTSIAKPMLSITAILLFPKYKVEARILSLGIVELIAYTGFFLAQIRRSKTLFSRYYWKYALKFNIPLIPHYLSQIILNQCDRIMIERIEGNSAAGIYSLAYNISQIMLVFNTAILNSMNPWIYKSIKEKQIKRIGTVSYAVLILIASVNIFLILLAPECIAIFAPKEYYAAIYVIPPIAMSVYFIFMYSLFAAFEFYYEKTGFITIASVSGALLNIILNYILIPKFGFIAAGYTTLLCYIVYSIGHYLFMRKLCKNEFAKSKIYDVKKLGLITIVFVVLGSFVILYYDVRIIRYVEILVIVILIFAKRRYFIDILNGMQKK